MTGATREMENNLKYFLVVAEELNISRAAKRLFITQQSLSMHIKKLEETYHTTLLNRKPHVSLTPAGEMLASTLEQIRLLEDGFSNRLSSMIQDSHGILNIGISHSRANIIMPEVIPAYKKIYPNVDVVLQYDSTIENLENRLVRGYVDLFIGITQISNESIGVVPLRDEELYVVISRNLFTKRVLPKIRERKERSGIDFSCFSEIPFMLNTEEELSYKIYNRFFEKHGASPHSIFSCNDSHLRTAMCANDIGATMMVELMLRHVHRHNAISGQNNPLYYFPVVGLNIPSILAYHKKMFLSEYTRQFINMVAEASKHSYSGGIKKTGQPQYRVVYGHEAKGT